jgi:hypothetical protein
MPLLAQTFVQYSLIFADAYGQDDLQRQEKIAMSA